MSLLYLNATIISDVDPFNASGLNETTDMFLATPSNSLIIVMFATGCFGNLLALYVLCRTSKKHKWKTFNKLVGLLAIFDFSGILAITPVTLLVYSNELKWVGGQHLCDYYSFFMIFSGLITVLTVGLMSLDRFMAVCLPYFYKVNIKPKIVNIIMIAIFLCAFLIAVLPIAHFGSNVIHEPGSWCFFDFHGVSILQRLYSYSYAFIGMFIISLTTILNIILIIYLGRERKRKDNEQRKSSVNSISNRIRKQNDIYFMVFLSGILLVFGICWTPFMIGLVVRALSSLERFGQDPSWSPLVTVSQIAVLKNALMQGCRLV
ncbi:hypothetical protein FSP39_004650 [Pinctada imbricata]|uniref:G-protein coupled receptors family 1 profile domain-containing protein n=1 Tax=Pinctada imbricata TaxID=66713 RepID=A0AA88XPY4_PINIB|nr:hypothetical protein FSP39_004650 [Pinctada imbricata]